MEELKKIIAELDAYRSDEVKKLSENVGANEQSIVGQIKAIKEGFKESILYIDKDPTLKSTIINNYKEDLKKKKEDIDYKLSIKIR